MSRALLLGGTGAMGVYLAEELVNRRYHVLITSRRVRTSPVEHIEYIQGDPHDPGFLDKLLTDIDVDVIIDFMLWSTKEFGRVHDSLLRATHRYVYLSSYRVFADSPVITETSPRLLEECNDSAYLSSDEYALAKARQEDILSNSPFENYTIVRPSITYSKERFQLCTYEVDDWLYRVRNRRPIPIASGLLDKRTTMTWAGDVAKMISLLIENPDSERETYNVVTSDNISWREVADIYRQVSGSPFDFLQLPLEQAIACTSKHQLIYDRMYDRVLDNSKVLAVTGLHSKDLKSPHDGLSMEFKSFIDKAHSLNPVPSRQGLMDKAASVFSNPLEFGIVGGAKYLARRFLPR